jgi:hypothetical protein
MFHPQIKHTIAIFQQIYDRLPPLVPKEVKQEMQHALEHLHNDFTIELVEVENVVIAMGKKIWPYWKAFSEFFDIYQGKLGEKFLLGKLSVSLKNRYKEFKEHGGDYHDLRTGAPMSYFTSVERVEFGEKLVEVDNEVRQHVRQLVVSTEATKYQDLIMEFSNILDSMEKRLDTLRLMAEDEEEHPRLAEEIRAQVHYFELGLCLLGPHTRTDEIMGAEEFFGERRVAKKLHRMK